MAVHKCNKCFHQAYVKTESKGNKEYCLIIDKEVIDTVKNCSEFVNGTSIKEPLDFLDELDNLIKNPNTTETRKINKIKKKIEQLRRWGKQKEKPKMQKTK